MKHIVFDHDGTLVEANRSGFELFTGMRACLDSLKELNYKIYVWTARDRFGTIESLKSNNVMELIDDLRCANDGPYPKPAPDGLIDMLESVDPKDVIVIGDSYSDMLGGKKYGAYCIGALWNKNSQPAVLSEYGADCLVDNVSELKDTIIKINN